MFAISFAAFALVAYNEEMKSTVNQNAAAFDELLFDFTAFSYFFNIGLDTFSSATIIFIYSY